MSEGFYCDFPFLPEDDRENIENKYHKADETFDSFNRMTYHGYDYDKTTGLSDEEIDTGLSELAELMKNEPHPLIIDINEHDYFPGLYSWGRLIDKYTVEPWYDEVVQIVQQKVNNDKRNDFGKTGTAWIGLDFDHTVPDWESMTSLGFSGLLNRAEKSYSD